MKKLAITLVVLLALLVAADFGAAAIAERQVSKELRGQLNLAENPDVRIHGFPFLTQVAAGDYRNVDISADGVKADPLQHLGVAGTLHHARVDTQELINGDADTLDVDRVNGRVRLRASDVGRIIDVPDLSMNPISRADLAEASGGSDDAAAANVTGVRLDGTMNIAGTENKVHVLAALVLQDDGKVRVEPRDFRLQNDIVPNLQLPDMFKGVMREQFATTLDPGTLPFSVTPTALRAEPGSLIVEGNAEDVSIDLKGGGNG